MFDSHEAQPSDLYAGREILRATYGVESIDSERPPSHDVKLDMARLVLQECRHLCQRAGFEVVQFRVVECAGYDVPAGCLGVQFAVLPADTIARVEPRECVVELSGATHPGRVAESMLIAIGTLPNESGTQGT